MLYHFLKFLMRLVLPVYYRTISITGLENIPAEGPVILACSHPNSFLDAILIGTYSPRPLHFLTRSDVFNAPWKKWILGKMNMVPIYRMRDGLDNLDKNKETFEKCRSVLRGNGVILIFSEGICIQELKLRSLKKGTARIALDFAQSGTNVSVMAVGLNYLHPMKFRKEVFVGVSPPLEAIQFLSLYAENPAKGILAFNLVLEKKLREQVIHIEKRASEKFFQSCIEISLSHMPLTLAQLVHSSEIFNRHQEDEGWKNYGLRISRYLEQLAAHQLSDPVISPKKPSLISYWFSLIMVTPGYLLSWLPFRLSRKLTRKKVRLNEFYDSVLVAGGMILSLVFCICLIGAASLIHAGFGLLAAGLIFFAVYISPIHYDAVVHYQQSSKYLSLAPSLRQQLSDERAHLLTWIKTNLLHAQGPSS